MSDTVEPTRLVDRAEVCDRAGFSCTTIWNMMRRGEFPRGIEMKEGMPPHRKRVRWIEAEVVAWIKSRPRQKLKGDDDVADLRA